MDDRRFFAGFFGGGLVGGLVGWLLPPVLFPDVAEWFAIDAFGCLIAFFGFKTGGLIGALMASQRHVERPQPACPILSKAPPAESAVFPRSVGRLSSSGVRADIRGLTPAPHPRPRS
jgi:hypothetical protein